MLKTPPPTLGQGKVHSIYATIDRKMLLSAPSIPLRGHFIGPALDLKTYFSFSKVIKRASTLSLGGASLGDDGSLKDA